MNNVIALIGVALLAWVMGYLMGVAASRMTVAREVQSLLDFFHEHYRLIPRAGTRVDMMSSAPDSLSDPAHAAIPNVHSLSRSAIQRGHRPHIRAGSPPRGGKSQT